MTTTKYFGASPPWEHRPRCCGPAAQSLEQTRTIANFGGLWLASCDWYCVLIGWFCLRMLQSAGTRHPLPPESPLSCRIDIPVDFALLFVLSDSPGSPGPRIDIFDQSEERMGPVGQWEPGILTRTLIPTLCQSVSAPGHPPPFLVIQHSQYQPLHLI